LGLGGDRRVGGVAGCGGWSCAPQKVNTSLFLVDFSNQVLDLCPRDARHISPLRGDPVGLVCIYARPIRLLLPVAGA